MPTDRPQRSAPPWKLSGYVIEDLIGFGGSAEVWRGRVAATGVPVAFKRVPVQGRARVQSARAEAALLSALDHPHLIRLHELVTTGTHLVLVLDLGAGGSLADLLGRRRVLTPGEVSTALSPVGAALAHIHAEGVVHGDVSPANVLFTDAAVPLLADLGVGRIIGDEGPVRSTAAYVDPSVANGCLPGPASDVFMLAATAVHALTGTPVWAGPTAQACLASARAEEFGDLPRRLADLPPALANLLDRSLSVQPHGRPTAAEFALDLRHCCRPIPVDLFAGSARPASPAAAPVSGRVGSPRGGAHRARRNGAARDAPGRIERDRGGSGYDRPAFDRSETDRDERSSEQFTHGVRLALATRPASRVDRIRSGLRRRPVGRGVAAAVVAILAVAGAVVWYLHRPGRPAPAHTAVTRADVSAVSHSGANSGPDVEAEAALAAVDRWRERAFATNDPTLLARVYQSPSLQSQDAALLARLTPPGCGLVGVRTSFSDVRAAREPDGKLTVTSLAALGPSTLRCGDQVRGAAPGEAPTHLSITLSPGPDGYRIAAQQRV